MFVGQNHRRTATDILNLSLPAVPAYVQNLTKIELTLAATKADNYWHGTNCSGDITYKYKSWQGSRAALSTWTYYTAAPSTFLDCTITFNTRKLNVSPAVYCAVVVHEYGHLNGKMHVRNPYNIMYPVISRKNIPRTCKH